MAFILDLRSRLTVPKQIARAIPIPERNALAEFEEKQDEDIYFAPERGNVVFSSALDGWAFTLEDFANLFEKRLGVKRESLTKFLWGDYFLDSKTKRILGTKHLKGRNLRPMFVEVVLHNIWAVYESTIIAKQSPRCTVLIVGTRKKWKRL